ncbi:protein kinase [Lujinxingia vulgaris]|uniref:Protein kinase n=1 Tax=Lujinxingia vulgaris TaxID=2600176 RepID=A0A5C6XEQ5_9DELT|nr:serine/threonine-protein kinase [Lujinxingia vulgaris]TXD35898.1 protein kinase [Lujinxingia vulgaris]
MTESPETESPSLVGTLIEGKYLLERELGAGGMGAVYLARHKTIEREVAIKLLHRSLASDASIRRRFETEARAIARLSHPGCVMLYEFGLEPELEALYAVFEYVKGRSLEKWAGQKLAIDDVLDLGRQVVAAIEHAHSQKIIHRDLKPDNIMVTIADSGKLEVKVLDFGIARIAEDDETQDQSRLTKMGQMFGTPPYMSPEQIRARLNITFATDIYSIGVILYELIEGRLPFLADSPIETVMLHLNEEVPPMVRSDLPEELRQIVMRCLEKDPDDRFGSCTELREALDRVVVEVGEVTALTDLGGVADLRGGAPVMAGELGGEPTDPEPPSSDPMVHAHATDLAFGHAPTLGASADSWQGTTSDDVGVAVQVGAAGGGNEAQAGFASAQTVPTAGPGEADAHPSAAAAGSGATPAPEAAMQQPGRGYHATEDAAAPRQAPETWEEMANPTQRKTLVVLMVVIGVAVLVLAGVIFGMSGESEDADDAAGAAENLAVEDGEAAPAPASPGEGSVGGSETEEGANARAGQGDEAPGPGDALSAAGAPGEVAIEKDAAVEDAPALGAGEGAGDQAERSVGAGEEVAGARDDRQAEEKQEVAPERRAPTRTTNSPASAPEAEEPEEPARLRLNRTRRLKKADEEAESTDEPARLSLPRR